MTSEWNGANEPGIESGAWNMPVEAAGMSQHPIPPSTADIQQMIDSALQQAIAPLLQTVTTLTNQLGSLSQPAQPIQPPPVVAPQPPANPPPTSVAPTKAPRPARPSEFDGDRQQARAFLHACDIYMAVARHEFPNDGVKIGWVLSYMKTGRALRFAEKALRYFATSGEFQWMTYSAFVTDFRALFFPIADDIDSRLKLESDAYYQGRKSVDDYIDGFQDLVSRARLSDGRASVLKFRLGLDPVIADTIAESSNPPDDDDISAWIDQARRVDRNRTMNKMVRSAKASGKANPHPVRNNVFGRNPFAVPPAAPPVDRKPPTVPTANPAPLPPGVPMDVDAARAKAKVTRCYRCGQTGHLKPDCPQKYDIRFMDDDELENAIANAKDAREAEERTEQAEGFGEDSG
jgi:zinc knuckle protein